MLDSALRQLSPVLARDDFRGTPALPYWPVAAILWGFPLSWLLGLTQVAPIVLSFIMLVLMILRGRIQIGVPLIALSAFALWIVPCVLMIDSPDRLIGYALRLAVIWSVVVVALYVYNASEQVTKARIISGLVFVWIFIVVCGFLGILAPAFTFTTPMGMLLPGRLLANEYVQDLFVPTMAEIQSPWGAPQDFIRPAAPFPYTNGWGAAMVLLTPVVYAAIGRTRLMWRRALLIAALCAFLVPAMATSNRGMFLGLGLSVVYITLRLLVRGQIWPAVLVSLATLIGALVAVGSGLLDRFEERQEYSKTTESRASLYLETLNRTLDSPILGYGAPRPSLTNYVSVGTQGYVWMVMFSYGFVGLLLLASFFVSAICKTWRSQRIDELCLHSSLIAAAVIIMYYGLDSMQWLTIGIVAALLLRGSTKVEDPVVVDRSPRS